jgi:hypothetical protein
MQFCLGVEVVGNPVRFSSQIFRKGLSQHTLGEIFSLRDSLSLFYFYVFGGLLSQHTLGEIFSLRHSYPPNYIHVCERELSLHTLGLISLRGSTFPYFKEGRLRSPED